MVSSMTKGRPKKLSETTTPVLLRVPDDLLAEIDAEVGVIVSQLPAGATITRADLMRQMLKEALLARKAKRAKERKR